jgi:hypothetical protein
MIPTRNRRKRRLWFTAGLAAVAVAALVAGPVADAAAHPRDRGGHDRGHDRRRAACRTAAIAEVRLDDALDDLVADGTLTQAQADAVAAAVRDAGETGDGSPTPDLAAHCAGTLDRVEVFDVVTDLLGLPAEEIRDLLLDGQSLAEIAADQGVERAALVAALQDQAVARLDEAEAAGRLEPERRAELEERLFAGIERLVDAHRGDRRARDADDTPATPPADATPTA